MLNFEEDFTPAASPSTCRLLRQGQPRRLAPTVADAPAAPQHPPRAGRRQARDQRRDGREPARPLQIQMGVGEIPRRLRQPLDAAGSEHEPRHRAVERPHRAHRRRAPSGQAQPRLLRHRRFAGRQQHRARHLSPHHRARVPPVPAAPGVRRGHPHPRLPVHRRKPGPGRRRNLQRLSRSRQHPRQG